MCSYAAVQRLPMRSGIIPRTQPISERPNGLTNVEWETDKAKAKGEISSRREWASRFQDIQSGIGGLTVKALLAGSAVVLSDMYLQDFMSDATRDSIVDVGALALGASLATQVGAKVGKEFAAGPDKILDQGVERMIGFNRAGGKHFLAKSLKNISKFTKWGALGVAGLAVAEGLIGQDPLGGTLEQLIPNSDILANIPNIEPSMAFPAVGVAVAGEIAHRLYKTQDAVYTAAADFITLDNKHPDKKSLDSKLFKASDKTLREDGAVKDMVKSTFLTGGVLDALWWNLQQAKFNVAGKVGVGSATLFEIVRNKVGGLESFLTNMTRYNSWLPIGLGITGLISPAFNLPTTDWMHDPDNPMLPSIWAGLAMTGIAKYKLIDKPQAEFMQGFSYAANTKLDTGRQKSLHPTVNDLP